MNLLPISLDGVFVIETKPLSDERGSFERTFCAREFASHGLNPSIVQCNISYNLRAGTLRGMHYQAAPHSETKLVRCISGSLYDVIIDLRPESKTFKQWFGIELSAVNHRMLYVPEGFAHGFQTLVDGTEVLYQMSSYYEEKASRGVRWDDPAFAIHWPEAPQRHISVQDRAFPLQA